MVYLHLDFQRKRIDLAYKALKMCKCDEASVDREAPEEEQGMDAENHFNLPTMAELEAAMCSPETSIVRKMAHLFSIKKHGGAGAMNLILESLNHDEGSILF
ncbi:HEAT repeat-containing protein, partial [Toxoplasma gondii TgCatPRC2]